MTVDTIRMLLKEAGIAIDGPNPWDIQVHDQRWYGRIVRNKNLGLGESYMDGWWDCERLDEMICRLLRGGLEDKVRGNLKYLLRFLPGVLFNLQSRSRARIIADHHYDLGNDLFFSFLDTYRQYSCGYFQDTDDLDQAQQNKLELICRKLNLGAADHVLDIGCGWGGLARYAAERFGCTVTAVNISKEQLRYAEAFCRGLPVQFQNRDYRAIDGRFDKIVSVGMFEHVGRKNYRTFMQVVRRCLKNEGIFLLHTIGGNTSRMGCDPWITKYIFPNGMLPSIAQIAKAAEGLFIIEDWHNLGPHYDKTLMAWNENFQQAWSRLSDKYDTRFKRMWEYYLLSCAGAFRARNIQVWQVVMTPYGSGAPQPKRHI
ncbi:MAG: cyclopropane fatty acyl phospholipid synthase [Deltaproteobacteria bacterium]|nr:cyclopropane fatty acyl phospholipid synthase [Deltaproteobacteria bacterium]